MHRMFFAILALSTSMAWAIDPLSSEGKSQHPGFVASQAAEQKLLEVVAFEKSLPASLSSDQRKKQIADKTTELQNQAYDQCKISIAAYQTAPSEAIDVSAVYFCLVNAIENCQAPTVKPACNSPIQSVLQIVQKQLAGKTTAIGLQNLIGAYYARQKRYAEAMASYYPAYTQFSKAPCSRDHLNQLVTILNLNLESGDQNAFNQYWKMTSYCETSGLIQPRGNKFVRDATTNRVTLALDPSITVASTNQAPAPMIPRELPAKIQPKPEPVQVKVAAKPKAKEAPEESDESDSEEEDIIASAELVPTPPANGKATPEVAKPAATTISAAKPVAVGTVKANPVAANADLDKIQPDNPEAKPAATKPEAAKTIAKAEAKTEEETTGREPAVANEVFRSIQEFVPGLLIGIAKNHPAWEASLVKRRANKNKSEKEARELEEIFKAKKESEKKAVDQMMSADPNMRAKQLKNVSRLRLGDSIEKIKAALGQPTAEMPDQRTLSYQHLATGATVGEVLEGKMPPFVALLFTFNPSGQLQEIKYSYPQGHGHIICR